MKKFFSIALMVIAIVGLQSCKKQDTENNSENDQPDAVEILTRDYWIRVKEETYNSNGSLTNVRNFYDKWVFALSKDFYVFDASDRLQFYGKWELIDDANQITIWQRDFEIDSLTDNLFIISEYGYTSYDYRKVQYFVRH